MFCFRRCIELLPRLILSPQIRQQNLSLEINPIDNAEPCYPQNNTAGNHLCDECTISILPHVCPKLVPILWLIEQICLLTIECLFYQFVPNTSISRQSVGTLLIILQLFPVLASWKSSSSFLKLWSSKQGLETCIIALQFCLPIRNVSQNISEHVLPCRRTTQLFLRGVSPILVIFQLLQQKYVIRTSPCIDQ